MVSDKKIWNDFRAGESYALSHIYYNYVQLLFGYGKNFMDDDDLIKDSIQDMFFDLIKSRKNLGETDNIKFYLLRSLRRKLVANLKKQNLSVGYEPEKQWQTTSINSAESIYIEEEDRLSREKTISKALQILTPKQREILYYKYICEFEYVQICEIMAIKYDSARKQVCRAIKELKSVFSEAEILSLFLLFTPQKEK